MTLIDSRRLLLTSRWLILMGLAVGLVLRASAAEPVDFALQVRPILANYCYDCHGPDENRRQAGLRLDTREGWSKKLESGQQLAIAGQREKSELWRRVSSHDPEIRMPAAESKKRLSAEQIDRIGRWIDQGAKWSHTGRTCRQLVG